MDSFRKGCALIRGNFPVDPKKLSNKEWAELFNEATWLEDWRLEKLAKKMTKLFGGKK